MDLLDIRLQNPWWVNASRINEDLKIRDFAAAEVKWLPRLMKYVYLDKNVVYSIRGPRQVGKTTLLKLLVKNLLEKNNAINVMYFTCDLVKDNVALSDLLAAYYSWVRVQNQDRVFIFLDEISSVKDWQKSIKFFIDANGNSNLTMLLTGSHALDIKSSIEQLPGRLGEKEHVSTHKLMLPMKFAEYVETRKPDLYAQVKQLELDAAPKRTAEFLGLISGELPASASNLMRLLPELNSLLDEYLITGGVMTAVNEYVQYKKIDARVYELYVRQLIGDLSRLNREEKTAKLILASILKKTCTPISWNSVRTENGIPSPSTVEQYANILKNMFVLNIFYKIELSNSINHASNKKLHVVNPFIFHALNSWLLAPTQDPFSVATEFLANPEKKSKLIESVIGDHLIRAAYSLSPSDVFDATDHVFYLTAKNREVDFVLKTKGSLIGVDVVYQNTLNTEDFLGLNKLGKGCLVSKKDLIQKSKFPVIPASLFLLYV